MKHLKQKKQQNIPIHNSIKKFHLESSLRPAQIVSGTSHDQPAAASLSQTIVQVAPRLPTALGSPLPL